MTILQILAISTALSGSAAHGQDATCTVIDRALRIVSARLTAISDSQVSMERGGLVDHRRIEDLLVIAFDDTGEAQIDYASTMGFIELTDGQKWIGTFVPEERTDGFISWDTAHLGRRSVRIEHIKRMKLRGGDEHDIANADGSSNPSSALGDRMVLTNGDVLDGFLDIAGEQFVFETNEGRRVELSFVQVAQLELANEARVRRGTIIWLADGSIVQVEKLDWAPGVMELTIVGRPVAPLQGSMLRGVVFAGESFAALAELDFTVDRVSTWMSWVDQPGIVDDRAAGGLSDVRLRGPIEVSYALPDGVRQFVTTVIVPRWAGPWADFVLVISVDGREVWRDSMDATGRSRREITALVRGGRRLTLRLEEGERGPVEDVVILERPMVLLEDL